MLDATTEIDARLEAKAAGDARCLAVIGLAPVPNPKIVLCVILPLTTSAMSNSSGGCDVLTAQRSLMEMEMRVEARRATEGRRKLGKSEFGSASHLT